MSLEGGVDFEDLLGDVLDESRGDEGFNLFLELSLLLLSFDCFLFVLVSILSRFLSTLIVMWLFAFDSLNTLWTGATGATWSTNGVLSMANCRAKISCSLYEASTGP